MKMNDSDTTGGSAFPEPVSVSPSGDTYSSHPGMTLRDYFAAQYMPQAFEQAGKTTGAEIDRMFPRHHSVTKEQIAARLSYQFADAMIAARK